MRLTRVYVDSPLVTGSLLELPTETGAHLAKVLRARSGDALILFDGAAREFAAVVETVRGSRVHVAVGGASAVDRESHLAVTLMQCVPRGDRMDFIVQKATELGVVRIVPVLSERSVVRLDERQAASKAIHWRAVAVNACEQCGRTRIPRIDAPQTLLNHLGDRADAEGPGLRFVLEPEALESESADGIAIEHDTVGFEREAPAWIEVAIGPEGGFGADELEGFRIAGFRRIQLGPRILRTETAAIAAMTWLQLRFGDLSPR